MQSGAKLSNAQVTKYALFGMTQFMAMMPLFMYYRTFMQVELKVSAGVMATLALLGTGIDFVFSIIAGPVVEKSNGKWGKFRSWFVIMPFMMFAGCVVGFIDTSAIANEWLRGGSVILGYVLVCVAVTFLGNANFGILAAMAGPNMENRNNMSIRAAQFMAVSTIVTSLTIAPGIAFLTPMVGSKMGYLIMSALLGATIFIGRGLILSVSKPFDIPKPKLTAAQKAAVPGVSLGDMFKSVATNSQLLTLMLVYTVYNFAFNFAAGFEMYLFMFVHATPQTYATFFTIHSTSRSVVSLIGSMIGPKIGVKLGKKKAMVLGLGIWGLGMIAMTFIGDKVWYAYTALACLNSFAMYIFSGFGVNYFLDAGEYGYYKTGQDNRQIAMAMFNIPMKIATMLAASLSGVGLAVIKFDTISVQLEAASAHPEIIKGLMLCIGVLPGIVMLLAALIMNFAYKITDADAVMYATENQKRAMEAMAPKAE